MPRCEPPTYVYVAAVGAGAAKVGVSNNPRKRVRSLPGGGSVNRLVQSWHRPFDAFAVEYATKVALRDMREHTGTFEYFCASADHVVAAVESAITRVESGTAPRSEAARIKDRRVKDLAVIDAFHERLNDPDKMRAFYEW